MNTHIPVKTVTAKLNSIVLTMNEAAWGSGIPPCLAPADSRAAHASDSEALQLNAALPPNSMKTTLIAKIEIETPSEWGARNATLEEMVNESIQRNLNTELFEGEMGGGITVAVTVKRL